MTQGLPVPVVPKYPGMTGAGVSSALSHKRPSGRCPCLILQYEMASTLQLVRFPAGSQAWFCLTHLVLLTRPDSTKSKRTQPLSPTKFLTFPHSRQFSLMEVELLPSGRQSQRLLLPLSLHKPMESSKETACCSLPRTPSVLLCHLPPPLLHGVEACPVSLVCGPATHRSPFLLSESTST